MEHDRTIDDVDDSVRVLQINCRLHKGKRDLNVSSLWQDDEGEMTRTILNPRSKMNSIGQSLTILTSPEIFWSKLTGICDLKIFWSKQPSVCDVENISSCTGIWLVEQMV